MKTTREQIANILSRVGHYEKIADEIMSILEDTSPMEKLCAENWEKELFELKTVHDLERVGNFSEINQIKAFIAKLIATERQKAVREYLIETIVHYRKSILEGNGFDWFFVLSNDLEARNHKEI